MMKLFYGDWVVHYSIEEARYGEDILPKPTYRKSILDSDEFLQLNYVDLKKCGIGNKQLSMVQVFTDADYKEHWESIGDTILYSEKEDKFVLWSGGVYFELVKRM